MIVEDGTGLPNATSYVSSADCALFAVSRGLDFDELTGDVALVRATAWLDAVFLPWWPGVRSNGRAQALQWPRFGDGREVTDRDGNEIAKDEVPSEVVTACCLAAIYEQVNPGGLTPELVPGKTIKKAEVYHAVTVEYAGESGIDAQRTFLTAVADALAQLIGDTTRTPLWGETVRR